MLRIAVCDDEKYFRDRLKELCRTFIDEQGYEHEIDCFESGEALLEKSAERFDYSIVFLDVNMKEMDGIETASAIRKLFPDTYIVFVTAYITYALDGYKVDAIRFLLKEDGNLEKAVKECLDTILGRMDYEEIRQTFTFQNGKKDLLVERILYVESRLHKVIFYVMEEKLATYYMYDKLDIVEKLLSQFGFYRIHQSYLVNIKYVKDVGRYKVKLFNGTELGVSKKYYKNFEQEYIKLRCDI